MRPRIPASACLLAAALAAGCASSSAASPSQDPKPAPAPAPASVSPTLYRLLDLEDARAPLADLEPFLRDADPEVRARAALAAARKGGKESAALLRLAARDPEARVREAAAFAMGISEDPDLAGDALGMTRRTGASTAEIAAAAASAVRLGGERVWREEAFGSLFAHENPDVRRAAWRALVGAIRGWKEKPEGAPEWMVRPFAGNGDPDPIVRASAALAARSLAPVPRKDGDPPPPPPSDVDPYARNLRLRSHLGEWLGKEESPDARGAVLLALGAWGTDAPLSFGADPGREPVPGVRVFLARSLARVAQPAAVRHLQRLAAEDPEFSVRAVACESLGAKKSEAADAVPALVKAAAEDPSRLVRVAALTALHAIGGDEARKAVAAAMRSEDPFVRAAAAGSLLTVQEVGALAADPEVRVREAAVDEAGKRKEKDEGKVVLLEAVQDPDPVVAAIAAGAIGEAGYLDALGDLEDGLEKFRAPEAAPDEGADFRAAALEALAKLKVPDAAERARAHLSDPDPSVRDAAAKVLEEIEGKRPELPPVRRLLPFPDAASLAVRDEGAPRVLFETDRGAFVVQTLPSAAPVAVARFLERVRAGGYDGTLFHRIVPAFVVQGGDPRGDGSGSGGATTRQEFSPVPYDRGVLGVPRSNHPDSGGCQLFFCHGTTPHLDQRYTVTGRIVEGVEVIDRIDLGDRILRATVE